MTNPMAQAFAAQLAQMQCQGCGDYLPDLVTDTEPMKPRAPLTDEQHATNNGTNCPYCGSDQLEGDEIIFDAGRLAQEMYCNSCERAWFDEYKLVGYTSFVRGGA